MERATSREQNRILLQINHIDERGIGGKDGLQHADHIVGSSDVRDRTVQTILVGTCFLWNHEQLKYFPQLVIVETPDCLHVQQENRV